MRDRVDLTDDEGFGIIEVLVSSIMVVLISLALFTAIDAAGRTADNNKSKSVASSLAQDDQERLRSIAITALARSTNTRQLAVDGETYTVVSTGEYLPGSAGSDNCASNDEAPKYVKITSTVSWQNMGSAKPVVANSLRATPSGTIGDFGSLAVDINGRPPTGTGQSGIAVTITPDATAAAAGGVTTTSTTNAKGCVIFGYIRSGRYTITASKPGYVLAANPNLTAINEEAVVAADSIASKSYTYDQAGAARVAYKTTNGAGVTPGVEANTNGEGFTIANALLGTPAVKTFTHPTGLVSPDPGALVNFPFTTNYEVWAGTCLGAKPSGGTTAPVQSLAVPAGGQSTVTSVREPKITFNIKYFTNTAQTTTANVNDGRVRLAPTDSTCTAAQNLSTNSSGAVTFIAPYGDYTLCYQNKATSPTAKLTWTGNNDTANGKTVTPTTLPYRAAGATVVSACW